MRNSIDIRDWKVWSALCQEYLFLSLSNQRCRHSQLLFSEGAALLGLCKGVVFHETWMSGWMWAKHVSAFSLDDGRRNGGDEFGGCFPLVLREQFSHRCANNSPLATAHIEPFSATLQKKNGKKPQKIHRKY